MTIERWHQRMRSEIHSQRRTFLRAKYIKQSLSIMSHLLSLYGALCVQEWMHERIEYCEKYPDYSLCDQGVKVDTAIIWCFSLVYMIIGYRLALAVSGAMPVQLWHKC